MMSRRRVRSTPWPVSAPHAEGNEVVSIDVTEFSVSPDPQQWETGQGKYCPKSRDDERKGRELRNDALINYTKKH
jgi:hypothetical protein